MKRIAKIRVTACDGDVLLYIRNIQVGKTFTDRDCEAAVCLNLGKGAQIFGTGNTECGKYAGEYGEYYQQYFENFLPGLAGFGIKVVIALLVFVGGRKVIQWIVYLIKTSMQKTSIDKGVIQFVGSLLRVGLYVLLVFTIATHFGVKESSVAALLGTAGVTVGLALQGGLANIAGGIMLLTFKPFQVGDYVIIAQQNECEGTVYKIEICYTTLISIDNKHIVIPQRYTVKQYYHECYCQRSAEAGDQSWHLL